MACGLIYKIAKTTKNPEICLLMETQLNQDTCHINLARITQNKEICEKIDNKLIRTDCFAKFN